jgi:hypothetical protein
MFPRLRLRKGPEQPVNHTEGLGPPGKIFLRAKSPFSSFQYFNLLSLILIYLRPPHHILRIYLGIIVVCHFAHTSMNFKCFFLTALSPQSLRFNPRHRALQFPLISFFEERMPSAHGVHNMRGDLAQEPKIKRNFLVFAMQSYVLFIIPTNWLAS